MPQTAEPLLNPLDRSAIERILAPCLKRQGARLVLFGSRARGDARTVSDIDLAVVAEQPIPPAVLAEWREALEESRIPFRIDLIDYAKAPEPLRAAIDREGVPWPMSSNASP